MNRFAVNPTTLDIQRSRFPMNHSVKFSFNVGDVIPFDYIECLPGDTFEINTSKVIRVQPLVAPIMDNLYLDVYWFFVPNRLVWTHFINFMGENTEDAWTPQVNYTIPQITAPVGGWNVGTIADYLGIPPALAPYTVSALPFRSYALVCDQWFRSENLQNPVHVSLGDSIISGSNGSDQVTDIEKGGKPFVACKFFDVFTAALPEPQKGPAVEAFLDGKAPVLPFLDNTIEYNSIVPSGLANSTRVGFIGQQGRLSNLDPGSSVNMAANRRSGDANTFVGMYNTASSADPNQYNFGIFNNLWADLTNSGVGFSINMLRQAFATQRYFEKLARGGSRYIEIIKSFYSISSPDSRLQRSEYLGGSRIPIQINQVVQQSATDQEPTPLGDVAGMSVTGDSHSDVLYSCTEHGALLGVCVVRQNHTYQQGVERFWKRKTLFDFYNPTFANIGEQPTYTRELFAKPIAGDADDSVFGYNEAWYDYRFKPSRISGQMRSGVTGSLDIWHLGDYYSSQPYLSDSWIREDKSLLDRCLAVTSDVADQLIADFYVECIAVRPMPLYSVPGLIDHH